MVRRPGNAERRPDRNRRSLLITSPRPSVAVGLKSFEIEREAAVIVTDHAALVPVQLDGFDVHLFADVDAQPRFPCGSENAIAAPLSE